MMSPIPQVVTGVAAASAVVPTIGSEVPREEPDPAPPRLPESLAPGRPVLPVVDPSLDCSVLTGDPLTTVTSPMPLMQVTGKTTETSPSSNNRRAVIGVCSTSVRASVPYLPLEKLGAVPTCQRSVPV